VELRPSAAENDEGDSKYLRKLPGNRQEGCNAARELGKATGGWKGRGEGED
jgi:hypothetical protein